MITRWSGALWLMAIIGCAAPPSRGPVAPRVEPQSEEASLKSRFEAAYFEIACMANRGVDPAMTITPLRRPSDYLAGLVERHDADLPAAMRVLERNGFPSIQSFQAVEMRLRSDRAYWNGVDARFADELLKCR